MRRKTSLDGHYWIERDEFPKGKEIVLLSPENTTQSITLGQEDARKLAQLLFNFAATGRLTKGGKQ